MQNIKIENETLEMLEKYSSLVDGELCDEELDEVLAHYAKHEDAAESLQTYHLIGDVLRSADFAQSHVALSSNFNMAHLRARIAREPLFVEQTHLPVQDDKKGFSFGWPKWIGFAAASGAAFVALFSFVGVTGENASLGELQTAAVTTALYVDGESKQEEKMMPVSFKFKNRVMQAAAQATRDSTMDYMYAHQQFGYGTAFNRDYSQGLVVQTSAQK